MKKEEMIKFQERRKTRYLEDEIYLNGRTIDDAVKILLETKALLLENPYIVKPLDAKLNIDHCQDEYGEDYYIITVNFAVYESDDDFHKRISNIKKASLYKFKKRLTLVQREYEKYLKLEAKYGKKESNK